MFKFNLKISKTKTRNISHVCHLKNRSILSVYGPDSMSYLQALQTNQMQLLDTNRGFLCAFLTPQGRVLFDAFIYHNNEREYLIETDSTQIDSLLQHLNRYKLRKQVFFEKTDMAVWQAWPEECSNETLKEAYVSLETHAKDHPLVIRDPRSDDMGFRFLLSALDEPVIHGKLVSEFEYDVKRITLGIPEGTRDFAQNSLPLELNLDLNGGVDFRKGCYLGQELTIRTHHTGVVRKRIVPFQAYKDQDNEPEIMLFKDNKMAETGMEIKSFDESKKKPVGRVGSVVGNIGLALIRLEECNNPLILPNGNIIKAFSKF